MPNRTNQAQAERFIQAAREAGCSENEVEIRENIKRIAAAKPVADKRPGSK